MTRAKYNRPPKLTSIERKQRDGMVWLLRYAHGITLDELSAQFKVSVTSIKAIMARVAKRMQHAAAVRPPVCPDYWRRLSSAGAIKMPNGLYYEYERWMEKP